MMASSLSHTEGSERCKSRPQATLDGDNETQTIPLMCRIENAEYCRLLPQGHQNRDSKIVDTSVLCWEIWNIISAFQATSWGASTSCTWWVCNIIHYYHPQRWASVTETITLTWGPNNLPGRRNWDNKTEGDTTPHHHLLMYKLRGTMCHFPLLRINTECTSDLSYDWHTGKCDFPFVVDSCTVYSVQEGVHSGRHLRPCDHWRNDLGPSLCFCQSRLRPSVSLVQYQCLTNEQINKILVLSTFAL